MITLLMDYVTLYQNHEILKQMKNCNIYVPLTNYILLNDMIMEGYNDKEITEEEKIEYYKIYKDFISMVNNTDELKKLKSKDIIQTKPILYNKEDKVYFTIIKSFKNPNLKLSQKTLQDFDIFDYDILNTCIVKNSTLFTSNDKIKEIIKRDKLNIEVIDIPTTE